MTGGAVWQKLQRYSNIELLIVLHTPSKNHTG